MSLNKKLLSFTALLLLAMSGRVNAADVSSGAGQSLYSLLEALQAKRKEYSPENFDSAKAKEIQGLLLKVQKHTDFLNVASNHSMRFDSRYFLVALIIKAIVTRRKDQDSLERDARKAAFDADRATSSARAAKVVFDANRKAVLVHERLCRHADSDKYKGFATDYEANIRDGAAITTVTDVAAAEAAFANAKAAVMYAALANQQANVDPVIYYYTNKFAKRASEHAGSTKYHYYFKVDTFTAATNAVMSAFRAAKYAHRPDFMAFLNSFPSDITDSSNKIVSLGFAERHSPELVRVVSELAQTRRKLGEEKAKTTPNESVVKALAQQEAECLVKVNTVKYNSEYDYMTVDKILAELDYAQFLSPASTKIVRPEVPSATPASSRFRPEAVLAGIKGLFSRVASSSVRTAMAR